MQSRHERSVRKLAASLLFAFTLYAGAVGIVSGVPVSSNKAHDKGDKALRRGDYQLAEKIFRELLGKDAHDNEARLGLSFALLKQRILQDAYDHAARVLLLDPLSARAHAILGSAILAAGDFRNSVEEFRTSLALNEEEALAIAGLAMVDFYENRLDRALPKLRRAASLDPDEPDYVFNLGQAAARSERYKEAADSYERFLVIAPKTDADRRARIRGLIDFLRYLGKQGSLYVAGGANRTSISFESFDNRPIFKIRINGQKEPFRFVLDTGSGMSVVSETTARRLGLRPVAKGGLARAVGGGGKFEIVYGYISSIEIGDVKVENIPVYIRRFFDDKVPVDGYLGLSVVSEKLAEHEQMIALLQPSKMRVFGAAGITEDVKLVRLPKVTFGLTTLERISAAVLDLEPVNETSGFTQSGIIGGNFLNHFRIYFDFARSIIRLEARTPAVEKLESIKPKGL